jgi:hypothetical protein
LHHIFAANHALDVQTMRFLLRAAAVRINSPRPFQSDFLFTEGFRPRHGIRALTAAKYPDARDVIGFNQLATIQTLKIH